MTESEYNISKQNRRNVQEAQRGRMPVHNFEIFQHTPKRKDKERKSHQLERKAVKRK